MVVIVTPFECVKTVSKDDLIKIRYKDLVYDRHWYQLELKERKKDETHTDVFAKLTDDEISLIDLRVQLQESDAIVQERLWKEFKIGFMKNIYCVVLGKIYSPILAPDNFFYNKKHERVLTFIRNAKGLEEINQEWLASLYKVFAFMLTPSTIELANYETDTIEDYEKAMSEKSKERFNDLVNAKSIAGLVNLCIPVDEQGSIESYLSIVKGAKTAIGLDLSFDLKATYPVIEQVVDVVEDVVTPQKPKPAQPKPKKVKKAKKRYKKGKNPKVKQGDYRQTVMFSDLEKNKRGKKTNNGLWFLIFISLTGMGVLLGLRLLGYI